MDKLDDVIIEIETKDDPRLENVLHHHLTLVQAYQKGHMRLHIAHSFFSYNKDLSRAWWRTMTGQLFTITLIDCGSSIRGEYAYAEANDRLRNTVYFRDDHKGLAKDKAKKWMRRTAYRLFRRWISGFEHLIKSDGDWKRILKKSMDELFKVSMETFV